MKEIDPKSTSRAIAFELWMKAPMPMVTLFKKINVTNLVRYAHKHHVKINMLMCYCIGKAASQVPEFLYLAEYLELTKQVAETCTNYDVEDSMVIASISHICSERN